MVNTVPPTLLANAGSGVIEPAAAFVLRLTATLVSGAAAQTATMTNGPTAGNPTKWYPVDDNGTTRFIPLW
jgi:hypothetical protein